MKYLARINPRHLTAIQLCTGTFHPHYYLSGVCIQPHPARGITLVATDGCILAAIHDPDGWITPKRKELIIPQIKPPVSSAIQRKAGKHLWIAEHFITLTSHKEPDYLPNAFDGYTVYSAPNSLIDGPFPEWRSIMPNASVCAERLPRINPQYLERFSKILWLLAGKKSADEGMRLESTGPNTPVIIRSFAEDIRDCFVGLIMPMRAEPMQDSIPRQLTDTGSRAGKEK